MLMYIAIVASCLFVNRPATADFIVSAAERLGPAVNSADPADNDWMPRLDAEGLGLTVFRTVKGKFQVWVALRATKNDPWEPAVRDVAALGPRPVIPGVTTGDGLEFHGPWYQSPNGYGGLDLYFKVRETMASSWSAAHNVGSPVNTPHGEAFPSISPDGLELYFCDYDYPRPGGNGHMDLWVAHRATRNAPWQEPQNLGQLVNSEAVDGRAHISADGLALFFDSNRAGGLGGLDLYMTRRKTITDPWEEAVNLGSVVNSTFGEQNPGISPDGRELYFNRDKDIWQAFVDPVVDFNADGTLDLTDMVMLIDHWETDDSLFDIGPMPWGDGIVDVEDLKVFIGLWEKEQ